MRPNSFTSNNISIWTIFQFWNNEPRWFSDALGRKDAARALFCARNVVGQPGGSAIYFSVDYDERGAHFDSNILPYFEAVSEVFNQFDDASRYRIGVYGNGLVCRKLKDMGLVSYTWLSNSRAYAEHDSYLRSNQWSIAQNYGDPPVCGFDTDTDLVSSGGFGQFNSLDALSAEQLAFGAALASSANDELEFPT